MGSMLDQLDKRESVQTAYDERRTAFELTHAIIFLSFYMLLYI